jgi:hypothetical protein
VGQARFTAVVIYAVAQVAFLSSAQFKVPGAVEVEPATVRNKMAVLVVQAVAAVAALDTLEVRQVLAVKATQAAQVWTLIKAEVQVVLAVQVVTLLVRLQAQREQVQVRA